MPVSSNSLFHFTNSADHLFNILKHNFVPRYCLESYYASDGGSTKFAFPMVCFCDIPLSQIKEHLSTYGNYGIGLSKEWGKAQKLNPILYMVRNSKLNQHMVAILGQANKTDKKFKQQAPSAVIQTLKHIKMYEGEFSKAPGQQLYRFYNEREWRYVPEETIMIGENEFNNAVTRNRYNTEVEDLILSFTPDDITYIIINDESEVSDMISALKQIKSSRYDNKTIEKLISRIITSEQILSDF